MTPENQYDTDSSPSNPYSPPRADSLPSDSTQIVEYEGIGRLAFVGAAFGILLVGALFSALTPIAGFLVGLVIMIPASSRLKNIGRNPAWCLLLLVPLLGLFVTVPCFLLPSGYQQHRKLDLAGKIVAGIFVALLVLVFISIVNALRN